MDNKIVKIPKLEDLIQDSEERRQQTELAVLLNQNPHKLWIKENPQVKGLLYIPIERIEYLLTRIFGKWWVEIKNTQVIANSVVVTVRLWVINPLTGDEEFQEGIGAMPIQTDKGASATDISKVKTNAIMLAAPAAESFSIKDAAEKFGKIFGKDLNRKDEIAYESMLPKRTTEEELRALYESKKHLFDEKECKRFQEILDNKETNSYKKLQDALNSRV